MRCAVCDKPLGKKNRTGRCVHHPLPPSAEVCASRSAAMKRKFATDPDFRARHKAKAGRQTEAGRKAISASNKARRIWEIGQRHITPEVIKRRTASLRAKALSHIPSEYRDLYTELRNKHRLSVSDATEAVRHQQEADAARHRREMRR